MSNVPDVWETVLLVAAVYRVWRLMSYDMVTDGLRDWLFQRDKVPVPGTRGEEYDDVVGRGYWALVFVQCPWCLGFWLTIVAWLAWLAWPHAVIVAAVPFAISTGVGLIPRNLDP